MQIDYLSNNIRFLVRFFDDGSKSGEKYKSFGFLPSKENPRWIIPLINRKLIISSLVLYQPSLLRAKFLKQLTIFLARLGASRFLFRDRIYFRRTDELIRKIFRRDDLYYAIFTGTEGCHRKVTVQVMGEKGTILGYIKVSDNKDIDSLLENEAEILEILSQHEIENGSFPKVLFHGKADDVNILVLDTFKSSKSTFSSKLSDSHLSFLALMYQKTSIAIKFNKSGFSEQVQSRIKALNDNVPKNWKIRFNDTFDYVTKHVGDMTIPFGLCHRDFTPWNTFFHDEKLYVFDWEYSRRDYPPLLDIFHFIIQDGILVRKLNPERLLKRIANNQRLIEIYCEQIVLDINLIDYLLLCYLLDISLFYIEREKGKVGGKTSEMIETWLEMTNLVINSVVTC